MALLVPSQPVWRRVVTVEEQDPQASCHRPSDRKHSLHPHTQADLKVPEALCESLPPSPRLFINDPSSITGDELTMSSFSDIGDAQTFVFEANLGGAQHRNVPKHRGGASRHAALHGPGHLCRAACVCATGGGWQRYCKLLKWLVLSPSHWGHAYTSPRCPLLQVEWWTSTPSLTSSWVAVHQSPLVSRVCVWSEGCCSLRTWRRKRRITTWMWRWLKPCSIALSTSRGFWPATGTRRWRPSSTGWWRPRSDWVSPFPTTFTVHWAWKHSHSSSLAAMTLLVCLSGL